MPGRAAERTLKIRDTRWRMHFRESITAADIFTLYGRNEGGGSKETIHRLRGREAFGDLALGDLAEDDSLQTR